ncbi:MAG: AAA family ATPase [Lachnospiraceae bacterium]|nr:AAA family ATPase [Lachnospiraceae bacterium]
MSIKINRLEAENIKRVKAVMIEPTADGLTVIGGNNRQGKSSVLDAITWALGGNKYRPSEAKRQGSAIPPNIKLTLSNGFVVERKGKNSSLKVTDPAGKKSGQQVLDEFVEQLALDLPKFMEASDKEKAEILLQILGIGNELAALDKQETELCNERLAIGRIADQKAKYAKEQPYYEDAPEELMSVSELIKQQQEILARNGENQKKRDHLAQLQNRCGALEDAVAKLAEELAVKRQELDSVLADVDTARKSVKDLQDESTEELEKNIEDIEEINRRVRANLDKEKAEEEAKEYKDQYQALDQKIETVRKSRTSLLKDADLPLEGLSVEEGKLAYKGQKWDNMAGSEQLIVAAAIVRKLNPQCGFVLLDKLEQMDLNTLDEFSRWLEAEGLQAIATRVSTGEECSIIIEDGYVAGQEDGQPEPEPEPKKEAFVPKKWEEGGF